MSVDASAAARQERARARAGYPGQIVRAGEPKPGLYQGLGPAERWARMSALCRTQWLISGRTIAKIPRSEWPGEVFRIARE